MNMRIDFTNLGGFPLDQDVLKYMQESYSVAFGAIAGLVGSKTIIAGCEVNGNNVGDGWIAYQGELIFFVGGTLGVDVIISETSDNVVFEDDSEFPTFFRKSATTGVGGAFPFSELVRLSTLQNIWLPGDIKEKMVDNTYITNNFDADGYGLNREAGWRILSKAYPQAAGKVMVNLDPLDADFNVSGKYGGSKNTTLTIPQLPPHSFLTISNTKNSVKQPTASDTVAWSSNGNNGNQDYDLTKGTGAANVGKTNTIGTGAAINNLQPYFVVLKLIKL